MYEGSLVSQLSKSRTVALRRAFRCGMQALRQSIRYAERALTCSVKRCQQSK
eukprot:CAMPEP_0183545752 /NCGR_PEP_ID=MMETSP0371-20130417/51805_1 /TAXON_ID=268820 /ORGANISM="Peridinium aciculiferum, Strain PAER-2" /LENGTH=51 /DNA_ID=CAMNT_0025748033 /DNA_START=144 /DNA_END=296 /DNA_ORIENTATION=-